MLLKPIRSRADHDRALAEIERLMGARRGSPRADRLEVLAALVAAYEAIHDPIDLPEPIAAIEAHMSDRGLGQADLARLLGCRSFANYQVRGICRPTFSCSPIVCKANARLGPPKGGADDSAACRVETSVLRTNIRIDVECSCYWRD